MIKRASIEELESIAQAHCVCFPDSFSTKLGQKRHLLQKLYLEYLKDNPELFLVAKNEDDDIVGFCMGYYCEKNNYQKAFLKHNFVSIFIRMAFLLITFNPIAWKKVVSLFKKKKYTYLVDPNILAFPKEECGDLLSICVLPNHRGDGTASQLLIEFEKELKNQNRKVCFLTVSNTNSRGIAFYKKNNYVPFRMVGKTETTFIHFLSE